MVKVKISLLSALLVVLAVASGEARDAKSNPYKVYVMLGFHTSFYHSWRGDSNDEAGFGTDIRVVRGILKQLNEANAKGLKARGYWDIDVYFTVEKIISQFAPDIIDGIKARVDAGLDEVVPAPYNNGILSAQTPYELERMAAWSLENPWGTGLKQLFGKVAPIIRPQEGMATPGMIPILKKAGIEGVILAYSYYPFTAFSNFIPALTAEQRHNPIWLKHETGPERMVLLPCFSAADTLDFGSTELWMLKLREMQERGEIKSDVVLHYNFDADAETWLPMELPYGLSGLPNTGGVMEIVEAVNKYDWADFTTPGEYLKTHEPKTEVVIRQDTADGAFDGYYSWAEKYESHITWTALERSRMNSYRAAAIAKDDAAVKKALWADRDSSFWNRFIALSTTHFGMSTPIINEERQAEASRLSGLADRIAFETYRALQSLARKKASGAEPYVFTVSNYARSESGVAQRNRSLVRVPVVIEKPSTPVLTEDGGAKVRASLVNVEKIGDLFAAEVVFVASFDGAGSKTYTLAFDESAPATNAVDSPIEIETSPKGLTSFKFGGKVYGEADFLRPFITYGKGDNPKPSGASGYEAVLMPDERLDGVKRTRLAAKIPIRNKEGDYEAKLLYTFTIVDGLPYLFADVEVDYPYTPPRDLIHTIQQKLRRLLDLNWREVGPFAIRPAITAPESKPLTIWKYNYLDVMSSYSLDYGKINPNNRELDAFNHQITNGWVAVTNGAKGLLIAEDASVNASFAFAPMRLRAPKGEQRLFVNPFGSYFGRQLDYSHLHKSSLATDMAQAVSAHMRPAGPSFNGKLERFSLMLAPYEGDAPPANIRDDAAAFFLPYATRYDKTPLGGEIVLPEDMQKLIAEKRKAESMKSAAPLPVVGGLLANPADGAVDLVWDIPRDERVSGFEIRFKRDGDADWSYAKVGIERRKHFDDMANGARYVFAVRTLSDGKTGEWTPDAAVVPGAVSDVNYAGEARNVSVGVILRLAGKLIKHRIVVH